MSDAPRRSRWRPTGLEVELATRYLRGRRLTRGASLTTSIAIGGVAVGVMALIVILGVMNGLRDDLRDRILTANPPLRILTFGASLRMDDWRMVLDSVRRVPGVVAAAPEVLTQSVILNSAKYPSAVDLVGVASDTGSRPASTLARYITRGDLQFQTTRADVDGGIILGHRLANRLSAFPGDEVEILAIASGQVNRVMGMAIPRRWRFEVTGLFDTGMYQYDDGFAVLPLAVAQQVAGLDTAVTGIQIDLADPWMAPALGRRLEESFGYPYRALDWQAQNATLFSALKLEKLAMGLIIFFIMIVAAFNIVGTLTMVVAEKTREIGILQAMGLPARAIGRVFLLQGGVIGGIGTALGVVLGIGIGLVVDQSGWIRIDPAVYYIDRLPVHTEPRDVLIVVAMSLGIALLATILPSRTATRLTPVVAIRHE